SQKKTTPATKQSRAVTAKRKDRVQPREAALERSGGHWWQWIKGKEAAFLAQTLGRTQFVIKNHGPNGVTLVAANGDLMELAAGAVRATYAYGTIRVENQSEASVLVEFDFVPLHLRN